MSLTATYDGKVCRIIKGRLHNGRPQRWTVQVTYQTPMGRQRLTVAPAEACTLAELAPFIEAEIRQDEAAAGGVSDVRWTAISR